MLKQLKEGVIPNTLTFKILYLDIWYSNSKIRINEKTGFFHFRIFHISVCEINTVCGIIPVTIWYTIY